MHIYFKKIETETVYVSGKHKSNTLNKGHFLLFLYSFINTLFKRKKTFLLSHSVTQCSSQWLFLSRLCAKPAKGLCLFCSTKIVQMRLKNNA